MNELIKSYFTGKVDDHIEYSRLWIEDTDPSVESHFGFIENHKDPYGVRCEYEGLVAAVDSDESEALKKFVSASSQILSKMPYPEYLQRKTFRPPSYNALAVLAMATSMTPVGINISNYDELRVKVGFKNVTLINVLESQETPASILNVIPEDFHTKFCELFANVRKVGIAAHELYGHGSGTLLTEEDVKDLPIKSFYKEGETYNTSFGALAASIEECRAELTAVYLAFEDFILDIFGIDKSDYEDFKLATIYNMFGRALSDLGCFSIEDLRWRQAHAQGRMAILKGCLIWSNGAVNIDF